MSEHEFNRRDFLRIAGLSVFIPMARLDRVLSVGKDAGSIENDELIEKYDSKYARQIELGYLDNVKPDTISELYAGIIAKSGTLTGTRSDKSIWITDQLGRIYYERSPFIGKDQVKMWVQNRDGYDDRCVGMGEAMLFLDLFPKDAANDIYTDYLAGSKDILTFTQGLKNRGLSVNDIIDNPNQTPRNPDLVWTVSTNTNEFAFGDVVLVGESIRNRKPEIGVVTRVDSRPDIKNVTVTFFNREGAEAVKVITVDTIFGLQRALGVSEFGLLRTKEIDEMVQIRELRDRFILNSSEVPDEIKQGRLGMHEDYNKIPEFVALQKRLLKAKSFKERGEILLQFSALMGVQTRDQAELYQRGYIWSENDHLDKCNIYSTSLLRAIGLEDSISHWVDKNGTPAFNTGDELSAHGMNAWMVRYGPDYGWFPVTRMTKVQRLDLLKSGHVMYGARAGGIGDTIVIFGAEGDSGKVLPVLTKASWNYMSTYPYRTFHFDDPMDYFKQHPDILKNHPDAEIIWAHKMPGVK